MGTPDEPSEASPTEPIRDSEMMRGPKGNQGNQGSPGQPGRDLPRIRLLFPYIALVLALMYSQIQQRQNTDNDKQDQINQAYNTCNESNDVRRVIRDLVSTSGQAVDLTAIPSYQKLDPAMQEYLSDLSKALSSGASETQKQDTLNKVPLKDCDALFPTHT